MRVVAVILLLLRVASADEYDRYLASVLRYAYLDRAGEAQGYVADTIWYRVSNGATTKHLVQLLTIGDYAANRQALGVIARLERVDFAATALVDHALAGDSVALRVLSRIRDSSKVVCAVRGGLDFGGRGSEGCRDGLPGD